VPLPEGYGGMPGADGSLDLVRVPRVAKHRGFIFASLAKEGPSLADWLGPIASSFDDMVHRAPGGLLEVAGGVSRHAYDGNWKLVIENHNDTLHPRFVHASSVAAARDQSDAAHSDGAGEVQIKQMRQNGAPAHVWESLGIWTTEWAIPSWATTTPMPAWPRAARRTRSSANTARRWRRPMAPNAHARSWA
jgi:phenylpropionate dioxygenase-like ring-hydroxylating dioxygenase large terminal subunit